MFGFLKRRGPEIEDFGLLHTDMHAHWLPGLDDGAKTMEDSLTLIRELRAMGYRQLIATPHVMADLYPNSSAAILDKLEEVKEAVSKEGIDIRLGAAAEYLLDEGFREKLNRGDLLTLPGKHILVELSFVSPPRARDEILFTLQSRGYQPILAHPERYRYYHKSPDEYHQLAQRGIKLQVNLLSLTGYYGSDVRKVALKLIDSDLVGILGTDAHHERHLTELRQLLASGKDNRPIAARSWQNQVLFSDS